nr:InlB B-repeat-containing protein [Parabacteroides goldsteinii]
MKKKERKNKWITVLITAFINLFAFEAGAAVDGNGGTVSSIAGFSSALGNAVSISGNVVKLTDDVNLKNTLEINTNVVLDLNGKIILYDRTGNPSENAVAINVNGNNANVVIKNGTIEVRAAKGENGGFLSRDGKQGKNAVCIQENAGTISIFNITFFAKPGEGGNGYRSVRPYGNDGAPGSAYTIDPNTGTVGDMIPYGAYIEGASSDDYNNADGYPGTSTTYCTTKVSLSSYTATYDTNGGKLSNTVSPYTLNTYTCPDGSREGYTFVGIEALSSGTDFVLNNIPVLTDRNSSGTISLRAKWAAVPYAISYQELNGVAHSNVTKYDITNGTVALTDPALRNGYKFLGWFDSEKKQITSITYAQVKNAIDQTYTITARWQPINYTVTFSVETTAGESLTYTVETTDTSLPEPLVVPAGQEFDGWQDEQGQKITSLPVSNPTSLTLSPIWKDQSYYAYFYDGNGSLLSDLTKSYIAKEGLPSAQFPPYSKEGYIFEGWFKEGDNSHSTPVTSIPIGTARDTKLHAYITPIRYSLTYDLKGGTYSGSKQVTYTFSEKAKLLTDKDISYVGHAFKGWFLQADCSGSELSEAPITGGTSSNGGRNVAFTAYAKWEKINYTIVFKTDGGTPVNNASYNVTDGIPADKMPPTSKDGYKFLGWYKDDTKIDKIDPGHEELVLTAKWELIPYSITYNLNGGTNPTDVVFSYTYEETVVLPRPTRNNYKFSNWYENSNFTGNPVTEIANHTIGPKVFYARWEPEKYTISFNANGGSEIADQTYTYGEETAFARKTRKTNYTFAGWYKDVALTDFFGDNISATSSGSFTLYAKWVPAVYTIEYDCYYGTNPSNATASYTINDEVVLPTPTRENFTFAGWYDNDYLKGEVQTKITKGSSGNKKFYATWTRANAVSFTQPQNGKIIVMQGDKELKTGDRIGAGISLTVTATATVAGYRLQNLLIGGTSYTSSPQTISMPSAGGLVISATFTENSAVASAPAPKIILSPAGMDKFPKGENVKVQLEKTDEATTLYYRLDGSPEKAYSGEFLVESAKDTVLLEAIAKKEGYRDGVTTRYIIFDNGKITLTFDLPLGVKATNPTGGDVVTATTTGGSFEFMLTVDKNYYTNLDSMVVSANDSTITGNASGLYTLTNCSSDITVTVSGLKAKTCTVTLQQTENGQIKFTDGADETASEVGYGSSVSITAVADEDFKFLQWNTGSQSNPLNLTVSRDTTISARFISDYKSYMMTLPQMEGVTVKPFSGYSTEVKKDGTFKFYLVLAKGYREGNLVVRANGEELTKNKGGYAIYHINKNISISVDGIVRDSIKLTLPDHVKAKVVETMSDVAGQGLFEETMLLLQAKAPEGKIFSKWTDGKTDNPRMATAVDAAQLIPLFTDKEDAAYAKVILNQSPGAGITGANSNMDAVKSGDVVQLKVVLLPAYSQSEVVLTADDKVLTPETSLRAASETKTYVYNLPVDKDGITVKVSGLKLNSYEVTVSQTNGGTVSAVPAGKVIHGDKVQLKAEAASGMLFVKWWDGNTLNPYPYTVTSDTEVKACFVGTESTVDNESIRKDDKVSVSVTGRVLSVAVAEESALYIWDYKGSLFRNQTIPAGEYTMSLPSGVYLVKVGDKGVKKIIIR